MASRTQTHELTFTGTEVRKRYNNWDEGQASREWLCLSLLAQQAPGIAPRPLRQETSEGAPVIVMERIAGLPLGGAPMTHPQTTSLGRILRRMYDIPVEDAEAAGLPERRLGPTSLPRTLSTWLRKPRVLARCLDPSLVANALDVAAAYVATDNAPEPRLSVLGNADLNPANVLWDGEVCRIVDFEDGGLTDPGFELADHLEHIAGRLSGVYESNALCEAVGLSAGDRDRVRRYRPLWAIFWLIMLLPGNAAFSRNPPGTTEDQANHVLASLEGTS